MLGRVIEIPSRRYGKYLVRSRLGVGGMAEVFLAEAVDETGDQLSVALKMMREGVSDEVFATEADLMGLLQHPNLVRRLEIGQAFGRSYIAMEFLLGGDLQGVLDTHERDALVFPRGMAVHVTLEALRGLAYFHQAKTRTGTALNLVHGDVNPANVFFSGEGEVKLGDFGVANSGSLNLGPGDGVAAGKLHYLSPEQTRGERLSMRSDLFSVGVMLYELVVGHHPFRREGQRPEQVMAAIRAAKPPLPSSVDKPLGQILRRALAADPDDRYPTAGAFAGDLLHYGLDRNLCPTRVEVKSWLEGVLGILA